jgi:D-alanine--poly(phosphoribitol) ligase subunit 2
MNSANGISIALKRIFTDTFHIDAPAADADLVETGILDSFQRVELLFQLEKRFGVSIDIEDIDLDDLRTLDRIGRIVLANTENVNEAELRVATTPAG